MCFENPLIQTYLQFVKISIPALWGGIHRILNTIFGVAIFIAIGQIFYMTNFSSIIAVSKENKYAKLVKYLPIDLNMQFKLKMNIGIKINLIIAVLISICNYICVQNITTSLIIFVILTILNFISEKFKLLTDLRKPKIIWDSEYTMMKENTNVMYLLFYTLVVGGVILISSQIITNIMVYVLLIVIITLVINIVMNRYIEKNK